MRRIYTYKEAVIFKSSQIIFILGGGVIGCELHQFFPQLVLKLLSLLFFFWEVAFREDHDVSDLIQALLKIKGQKFSYTTINKVEKKGSKKIVHYQTGEQTHKIEVEEILNLPQVPTSFGCLMSKNPE